MLRRCITAGWRAPLRALTKSRHVHTHPHGAKEPEVLFEQLQNGVVVTLNRPKALNALNLSMIRTMYPKYKELDQRNKTGCIIMRGAGGKAFCAGGDIRAIYDAKKAGDPKNTIPQDFFREEYQLNYFIGTLQHTQQVALLDGITMGGGVGLSVHGAFRIATENTVFAMPETRIGFFCDVGGSYFLPRLQAHLGTFLALTGHRLKAEDVFHAGVATHYVPSSQLANLTNQLARLPVHRSAADCEDAIRAVLKEYHAPRLSGAENAIMPHMDTIARCFSRDTVEDILVALERDGSAFAKQAIAALQQMSPTSLKVVLKQMREGAKRSFADCFVMEYRLSQRFVAGTDFFEGVRAVLVDKDQKPKWQPATLDMVKDEEVDKYFYPLENPADELKLPKRS